jgi:hypothetical protein
VTRLVTFATKMFNPYALSLIIFICSINKCTKRLESGSVIQGMSQLMRLDPKIKIGLSSKPT